MRSCHGGNLYAPGWIALATIKGQGATTWFALDTYQKEGPEDGL